MSTGGELWQLGVAPDRKQLTAGQEMHYKGHSGPRATGQALQRLARTCVERSGAPLLF